ncbi:hypothetical protein ElyMa_004016800 [Elysia marginata]|uniref:R3H domain-containing protein n=1 Tax=Elysia marginata TaxID=1093978 RepID=A0AAV4G1L5_9GAST|nr:hypothetical protein ElyMa_004016800 [Elysia marginata]
MRPSCEGKNMQIKTWQKQRSFVESSTLLPKATRISMPDSSKPFVRQIKKFPLEQEFLVKTLKNAGQGESSVVFVPQQLKHRAFELAHDKCGHQGPQRTHQILLAYMPEMSDGQEAQQSTF